VTCLKAADPMLAAAALPTSLAFDESGKVPLEMLVALVHSDSRPRPALVENAGTKAVGGRMRTLK
jgi:hypothetical protein